MNIAWKKRLESKSWWVGIISLVILLSQQFGFDLTVYIPKNYVDIINTIFAILIALGVTVDTSTSGISDSVDEVAEAVKDIEIPIVTETTEEIK